MLWFLAPRAYGLRGAFFCAAKQIRPAVFPQYRHHRGTIGNPDKKLPEKPQLSRQSENFWHLFPFGSLQDDRPPEKKRSQSANVIELRKFTQ
ncbi:hypothetical protein [uncultured Oscillibacter sp.]|uniref:hypothetical protein n=1 Tax=uncultured Oscillibacter sp. TaxID=876091 RepID=UPI0026E2CEB2|nr:hypothetical protein [uncultured Oscillibacter sp.]